MKERLQKTSNTTKTSDMGNIHKEIVIDNRIFLKGFHLDTKEDELENMFKTYGTIVETKIIRDTFTGQNRGFGFITFDSQHVAQDVLSSVKSVIIDGVEVTVGPAKIRRNPPVKSFRYNQYAENTYESHTHQSNQLVPYTITPEGYFTLYPPPPPQAPPTLYPHPPSGAPTQQYHHHQQQALHPPPLDQKVPYIQQPTIQMSTPIILESNNNESANRTTNRPSSIVEQTVVSCNNNNETGKMLHKSDINNQIVNSSAKIESSVVLAVSSNIPTVTTSRVSSNVGEFSKPTAVCCPSTVNAPQYYSFNQHPADSNMNVDQQQMKVTSPTPIPYLPPYDNFNGAHHHIPGNMNNGIDLALITNGIGNMMPSLQYVPMATFIQNTTQMDHHSNYFYKPETFLPSKPSSIHSESTPCYYPANAPTNKNATMNINRSPCGIAEMHGSNKTSQDCQPSPQQQSTSSSESVSAAIKAQNFVFMSTGLGKVNRVVVR